jgi:diguanylate cyclase (GGDEF)-like protein/PAS domain S-box-containing protein
MDLEKIDTLLTHQYVFNDPLHQLFNAVDAISVQGYDEERRVIYWNQGSELVYGYTEQEAKGKKLEDLIIPDAMREIVISAHGDWLSKGIEIPAAELTLWRKGKQDIPVYSSHVLFTNQFGKKQMYCIDIDLTNVKLAQAQAMLKQHMLETIFAAIPDMFFLVETDGTIIDYHVNPENNHQIVPKTLIGQTITDILPDVITHKFQTNIAKALLQGEMISFEYSLPKQDDLTHFEARINTLQKYNQIMVIIRDITEQHKSAELIRHQAFYDSLTLLPNRFLSLDRLSQLLLEAKRNNEKAAVVFLDIDDFKKINDSLGHEIGDKLLVHASKRLQQFLQNQDTVGRLGGDEFIILLKGIGGHHNATLIAEDLLQVFRQPFNIDNRELVLTVSIGVAMYPNNGCTVSDLLRNADTAMYQAKSLGRNTYSFFTQEMNNVMQRRFEIEEQMHVAIERKEFTLFFQPQICLKSHKIVGAEALLRWHNPVLGNVTPDEFIPIAEQTGLIIPIGEFVLKQALTFLVEWQATDNCEYTMAVNLSPCQFRDNRLYEFISQTLSKYDLSPKLLELEITEGVLLHGKADIHNTLIEISESGIHLSMDDFGTGYSSLSYLRQYPFDVLKIDRSFINGISSNQADLNLVKATIAMAHSLGLTVVAEGVETKEQLTLLEELNCDAVQGYYFSKPLPKNELLNFSARF